MNDLYDVITALRQKHRMSLRMLATTAKLPPTTLASMMTRRPSTIDKDVLIRIALALNVKWVDLLNKPDSYALECELEDRVPVEMSQEDLEIVKKKLVDPLAMAIKFDVGERHAVRFSEYQCPNRRVEESDFKRSFAFVLDKLNDDGLLEAMKCVLELANEPKFRKINKEDTKCQEEELRMAAEQSTSERTDGGKPDTPSDTIQEREN